MDLRDSIRRVFSCNPINEDESANATGVSGILETLILEELDAVSSYNSKSGSLLGDEFNRIVEIKHDEEEHVRELCDLLRKRDETRYNEFTSEHPEIDPILNSSPETPADDTELTESADDKSFTVEYKEDGKTKYSNVSAKSETDAVSLFNQTAKSQSRNVQGAKVVIQDTELEESQNTDLTDKVYQYLKYHMTTGDSSVSNVRDIKVLSHNDNGSLEVEVTYDVEIEIPETDPETGSINYEHDTDTRTNVITINERKSWSMKTSSVRESIRRVFRENDRLTESTRNDDLDPEIADRIKEMDSITLLDEYYTNCRYNVSRDTREILRNYGSLDSYITIRKAIRSEILRRMGVSGSNIHEGIEEDPDTADQEISSAATSINSSKLPALFKMVQFKNGSLNLDYGGGRFDNVADYLSSTYGATNLVYDPYNRSSEHNDAVLSQIRKNGGADTVTCSNVLNVIKEPEARAAVIRNCKKYLKSGGTAYFTVYEGSGTGEGAPTKAGYQLNKKTDAYVDEIAKVFSKVTRKGKLIIAK